MLRVLKLRCSLSYASNLSRLFMAQSGETFRYYCTVKSRTSLTIGAKQNIKGITDASHLKIEKSVLKSETFKENATVEVNKKIKSTGKHRDSKKITNTLTSTDTRHSSTDMKKEHKNLQQYKMNRDLVPDYIMLRLRNDVMGGPEYSGRFSAGRKPWVELSETSVSLLQQLKLAKDLSAMQQILDKISNEKLIKFLEELVSDTSFLKQSSQGRSGQGSYLTDGSSQRLRKSTSLIDALITECQTRMHSADGAVVLLFVDIIKHLTMNIHNGEYLWKKVASLALKIFEDRWDELSIDKRDVLGVCYVIGTFRNSPVYLLHFIEMYIHSHSSQLTLAEIALICHAFFAANTSIDEFRNLQCIAGALTRELDSLIQRNGVALEKTSKITPSKHKTSILEGQDEGRDTLREGAGSLKFYHLSCILKALRHSQYDRVMFYEHLGDSLVALSTSLGSASLADLSTLMLAYASLSIIHPKMLQTISFLACDEKYIGPHASPRMKDLGRIVWALAELRQEVPKPLSNKLINVMRGSRETMLKYPESCVESLVGLAVIGIYPKDLLEMVLSKRFDDVKKSRPLEQDFQMRLLKTLVQMDSMNCSVTDVDLHRADLKENSNVTADAVQVNNLEKSCHFEHSREGVSSSEVFSNSRLSLKNSKTANATSIVDESLKSVNVKSKKKLSVSGIVSDIYQDKKNITASATDGTNCDNVLGVSPAGFSNNQGIVHRILSGAESMSAELKGHPISSSDDDVKDVEAKSSRSLGDIVHELKTRQGLASFVTALEKVLGTNGTVHVGFVLPFSRITDIIIRVDLLTRKPIVIESSQLPWQMSLKDWNTKYGGMRKDCSNSNSNTLNNLRDRNEGVLSKSSNYEELKHGGSVITGQVNNSSVKIKNPQNSQIKKLEPMGRDLHSVIPKIERDESVKNLSSLVSVVSASDLNQIYRSCESVLESVLRERNGNTKNNFNPVSKDVDNFCDRSKRSSGFIVIKVLGENQYSRNTAQMLGLPALELGLLSRLNYEVNIIEPDVAKKLDAMNQQDRELCVRKFLKDVCDVCID